MHKIGNFTFDAKRLILYDSDLCKNKISIINSECPVTVNTTASEYENLNENERSMDGILIRNIGLCLTNRCNLTCDYCFDSSNDDSIHNLQLDDVIVFVKDVIRKRAIKKLFSKKDDPLKITFTGGGEPTYEWDLFKGTVRFIKNQGIPVEFHTITNGVLSNEQRAFIAENFNSVTISYDGLPEIQDRNRKSSNGRGTSEVVLNSIREFVTIGIKVTIRTTVWERDFSRLIDMCEHIFSIIHDDSKFKWSVQPIIFEGRALEHLKSFEHKNYNEFLSHYIKLVDYILLNKSVDALTNVEFSPFTNNICNHFCGAYKCHTPWLLPDKTIINCMDAKDDKVCIGIITDGRVEYFKKYRDGILKIAKEKYNECVDCIAYPFCKGGCPLWHTRMGDKRPPECEAQVNYWNYLLDALLNNKYSFGWKLEPKSVPGLQEKGRNFS